MIERQIRRTSITSLLAPRPLSTATRTAVEKKTINRFMFDTTSGPHSIVDDVDEALGVTNLDANKF